MKKIFSTIILIFIIFTNCNAQFGFTYNPSDSSYLNYGGWSYLPMYMQKDSTSSFDSYYIKYYQNNIYFMKHWDRNDGIPTGIAWIGSDKKLKYSPISQLYTLTDSRYLQSFTEVDPAVPSYSKSLTAFSVIKTSTDPLYKAIGYTPTSTEINTALGYTPLSTTGNGSGLTGLAKTQVGLSNCDNTSDVNKPVSTAQAASIATKFTIPTGTTAQYLRGDGTVATFPTIYSFTGSSSQYTKGDGTYGTLPAGTGTVTSVGLTSSDFTISGSPITTSGSITANLNTSGVTAGTYDKITVNNKGIVTAGANKTSSIQTRAFNTAFQPSTTRDSEVKYTVSIACTISLTTGQSGSVSLQTSPDNVTFTEVGRFTNTNTGTLTVGLNLTNTNAGQITGFVPAGYYVKLVSSGTGTVTYITGQELLY